jgi:hypothetical protein
MQNYSKQIIHELCEDLINNIYIKGMRHNIYTMNQQSDKVINEIKSKCYKFIDDLKITTYTKPGSIEYLVHGPRPSNKSINIKLGRLGEFLSKELIKLISNLELMTCGIQKINNKKKDVDLIFKDNNSLIIYYYELKGNIELDTEKLPATINKCKEIENSLKETYPDYKINCAILNWSVYDRKKLTSGLSNIKAFENGGIKIHHMEDFFNIINICLSEEDYYSFFREIGTKIDEKSEGNI